MTDITPTQSESQSTLLSELLSKGANFVASHDTSFVCHTSTIPLATTVDEQYLLSRTEKDVGGVSHSIKYVEGYDAAVDYRCCKKHCMYVSKNGKHTEPEFIRVNCPCRKVFTEQYDGEDRVRTYLQPLCYLQVIKELRYDFGYRDASACDTDEECCHNVDGYSKKWTNRPTLDMTTVMFCQNSQSILDTGYSRILRDEVGFSGWEAVHDFDALDDILRCLYWYRQFTTEWTRGLMAKHAQKNFRAFKSNLEQVLHTLNGVIAKKLLCFPCEMEGYTQLAKNTALLFSDLMADYLPPDDFVGLANPDYSLFLRMKQAFKSVKQHFASESLEMRMSVLDTIMGDDKNCKFRRFFGHCVVRLRRRIDRLRDDYDEDYTMSPAWVNTMAGFSQTRNMGYLPAWVAEIKRKQFRENLSRERIQVPKEQLQLVRAAVMKRAHEMGIETYFLNRDDSQIDDTFREVISSIKLPVKPTASIHNTVSQGGKVEDARQLLQVAQVNSWSVPRRNLRTGAIVEVLKIPDTSGLTTESDLPPHEGYLFWTALQIFLNYFARTYKRWAHHLQELPGSEPWERDLWRMAIVHISEPGKERNLTKTSPILAWVLTVASKVSQSILALSMDHRAGLVLSAQDWMHQRRISSQSHESFWMYDNASRRRQPGIWNGYQDWTESTDFIPRQVGGAALQAWFQYIAFPRWFGDLVLVSTQRDYDVSEYTHTEWQEGVQYRRFYKGKVTEGFMMSMPLTKTILHLMHDVNIGTLHILLRSLGVEIAPQPHEPTKDYLQSTLGQFSVHASDV